MNQEKLIRYALRGAQSELSELRIKLAATQAVQPCEAGITPAHKESMVRAMQADVSRILDDIHELEGSRVGLS